MGFNFLGAFGFVMAVELVKVYIQFEISLFSF